MNLVHRDGKFPNIRWRLRIIQRECSHGLSGVGISRVITWRLEPDIRPGSHLIIYQSFAQIDNKMFR